MTRPMNTLLRRFARSRRGVSLLEFALIAPILVTFYFASVELSVMLSVDRKATQVASTIGDLVAQDDVINQDEINDVFAAAAAVMEPWTAGDIAMRVTSLQMDTNGDVHVRWSEAHGTGLSPFSCGDTVPVPTNLLDTNQTIVRADVLRPYESTITPFLDATYDLTDTFYLRPRRSLEVMFDPETQMCEQS